ncbi:MAG: hypothetical protein ABIG93_02650 [archaeon]|nr:hypothetical protein [Nanoarchaeota archaeon]
MALGKLAKKYVNIIILVLIAAGFTLPGALYFGGSDNGGNEIDVSEQRVCQVDAHCYLNCDGGLKSVMCQQNLCVVNSCDVESMYEFQLEPIDIILEVEIDGEAVYLNQLVFEGDYFVQFLGDKGKEVQLYAENLNLDQILEKVGIEFVGNCLNYDNHLLCESETNEIIILINGEERFDLGYYVPNAGDEIMIIYG